MEEHSEENGVEDVIAALKALETHKTIYTKYTFSMFGGEIERVSMIFQNRMRRAVMDRFGRDAVALKEDERHFRITVPVAVSQQFFDWVFSLGKAVRIISPEGVREAMKKSLADIAARYEQIAFLTCHQGWFFPFEG